MSNHVWLHLLLGLSVGSFGCHSESPNSELPSARLPEKSSPGFRSINLNDLDAADAATSKVQNIHFQDLHDLLGVNFVYENGTDNRVLMVQSTGGGGGWIDFDRDSWPDLFLVQGGNPTAHPPHLVGDRLLRSRLCQSFPDVSDVALPGDAGFGQGMAAGDFNEDGFDDIFVTNTGANVMMSNCGDGTFVDMTNETQTGDLRWGTSAAWSDLDHDNDLDLFVCNYCRYDVFNPVVCRKSDGTPGMCHPEALDPDFSECYENLGNGQFARSAKKWGLADKPGKALGVVAADFNNDGLADLFVANDTMANFLYLGQQTGGFSEQAIALGCAYNTLGQYQANMGVACNDYDGNGFLDLYVTTFTDDSNTLFANLGATGFRDVTRMEGLHSTTIETLGFGTVMTDFDADGAMDLLIANGHIDDWRYKGELWKMQPEVFTCRGQTWAKLSADTVGSFLSEEHLGRAVSMADCDRDGDTDLLVVNQNEAASLLINQSKMQHWLRVELLGKRTNRRGIGAKITVRQGDREWTQQLVGGSSYLTTHEPALFFGLGNSSEPCEITVHWPNSSIPLRQSDVSPDQQILMVEALR